MQNTRGIEIPLYTLILILILIIFGCNVPDLIHNRQTIVFPERYTLSQDSEANLKLEQIKNILIQTITRYGLQEVQVKGSEYNNKVELSAFEKKYLFEKKVDNAGENNRLQGQDAEISINLFLGRFNSLSSKYYFVINIVDWSYPDDTVFIKSLKNELKYNIINNVGYEDVEYLKTGVFILNN